LPGIENPGERLEESLSQGLILSFQIQHWNRLKASSGGERRRRL
jgi:hypothetical protein